MPDTVIAIASVAAAAVAVIVTLHADFLAYPGWLALQKADVIIGPVGIGLYWKHRRPESRFGSLLIALGVVNLAYIAQSSSNSASFTFGVEWESVITVATLAIILVFPSGRFRRADVAILAASVVFIALPNFILAFFAPGLSAVGALSACRDACPANALFVSANADVLRALIDTLRIGLIAVDVATISLLVYRMARGTPPQRRALAIGTPLALVFLVAQAGYQLDLLLGGSASDLTLVRWAVPIARSALWYGFLLALIVAQLFAARVLRSVLATTMRRPSLPDLAALLRRPLGDPSLEIAFWDSEARKWSDGEGTPIPALGPGRVVTEVERDGRSAVAIVHDEQLSDDPELLQAAGATALLVFENAELQAAWNHAMSELRDSRARIASASARERRKLEQDLHDGAQQALVALQIKLAVARERADGDDELLRRLDEVRGELDDAINELRDIAQGIYPTLLAECGLPTALQSIAQRSGSRVSIKADGVDRYPPEVESALYYCCREALQNAVRHGGGVAHIAIRLRGSSRDLHFEVVDDGRGFDVEPGTGGTGLRNMADRIEALDGRLEIVSSRAEGTRIVGSVPLTPEKGRESPGYAEPATLVRPGRDYRPG